MAVDHILNFVSFLYEVFGHTDSDPVLRGSVLHPFPGHPIYFNLMWVLSMVCGEKQTASLKHIHGGAWSCHPLVRAAFESYRFSSRSKLVAGMMEEFDSSFDPSDQSVLMTAQLKGILRRLWVVEQHVISLL